MVTDSAKPVDQFAAFRRLFPATQEQVYLDVAARSLISSTVGDVLMHHIGGRIAGKVDKAKYFDLVEQARARFAAIINAQPDEISLTKNVSDGINAFAHALPWREGDNVVLCEALEHPANIFVWQSLARSRGIRVKTVAPRDNRIPLEDIVAAMDERTRVVTVSSVSFSPGLRFPLGRLGDVCRSRGILLLVDGAQSIGIVETDVVRDKVDAFSVSTQKGLLGLYGMGFLYVRESLADELQPAYLSRMGVDLGNSHEASSGTSEGYRLAKGARRFDVGNFNYAGAVVVNQSMTELQALGAAAIETYVCGLARRLAEGLEAAGVPLVVNSRDAQLAHIVPIGDAVGGAHDTTDSPALLALSQRLKEGTVCHTIRRGIVRLSFHAYNNVADVQRVIDIASKWTHEQDVPPVRARAS